MFDVCAARKLAAHVSIFEPGFRDVADKAMLSGQSINTRCGEQLSIRQPPACRTFAIVSGV